MPISWLFMYLEVKLFVKSNMNVVVGVAPVEEVQNIRVEVVRAFADLFVSVKARVSTFIETRAAIFIQFDFLFFKKHRVAFTRNFLEFAVELVAVICLLYWRGTLQVDALGWTDSGGPLPRSEEEFLV